MKQSLKDRQKEMP